MIELHITLIKSEKGSLGFTVTKGNQSIGCYVHDVIQDPAKSDGRLRPGDRLIKVRHLNRLYLCKCDQRSIQDRRRKSKKVELI